MSMTAGELAARLGGEVVGDATTTLRGVGSCENARADELTYVESEKHLRGALGSAAGAVLVAGRVSASGKTLIRVEQPKRAFARAVELLVPEPPQVTGVHPTAVIHPTATLGEGVAVGAHAVIEEGAGIGAGCQIGPGCCVGAAVELGEMCVLFARVTLYRNVRLGSHVRVHSGTVIGCDGFGYVPTEAGWEKFPQRGTVVIEDEVEIGANCAIDRGALDETRIGRGTKLDNLVHVGHNVIIGRDCVFAAQTGISGSVKIGDRVISGGQVGIGDHCCVEEGAVLGGQAGILSNKVIRRGQTVWGTPARPLAEFKKSYSYIARLPDFAARLAALERKVE